MEFKTFGDAVAKQFAKMSKDATLFTVDVPNKNTNRGEVISNEYSIIVLPADSQESIRQVLWNTYINAFPEGSNPIYRERTEHDCNCCKNFIRTIGNVVSIAADGTISTIWDVTLKDEPEYQIVANALAQKVRSLTVNNVFYHYERSVGKAKTFEQIVNGDKVDTHAWNHFYADIPVAHVRIKDKIATLKSEKRSAFDVFERALREIDFDSIETVLELINQNSIYRGAEHKFAVTEFLQFKKKYEKVAADKKAAFVWANMQSLAASVHRFKNTSIGTLVADIASGEELDVAVRKFEAMVAGPNYKRPTALVTAKMVEDAKKKIDELGLTSALERRYAKLTDISINNVLFADRSVRKVISGDVFDDIASKTKKTPKTFDKVQEVGIEKFLTDILPTAESIEVLVENTHASNFVSLIAPANPTARNMFKWDNGFSWSYTGDMADAVKERVKQAGGNVTGDVCCRLAWYNYDDLDFHMHEPNGGHIYFGNRYAKSGMGGNLDVDMNAGSGSTRTPVENIVYESASTMKEGEYVLKVNNYSRRESSDTGFEVHIDIFGQIYTFTQSKNPPTGGTVEVARIKYSKKDGFTVSGAAAGVQKSKTIWNINTMDFVKVGSIMHSPNYWDGHGVGNKHYFFMLEGCKNDGVARGFYNEFLCADLDKHRKVMEIVGSKMKTAESDDQLSGLGFSSTKKASLVCKVNGAMSRVIKIIF